MWFDKFLHYLHYAEKQTMYDTTEKVRTSTKVTVPVFGIYNPQKAFTLTNQRGKDPGCGMLIIDHDSNAPDDIVSVCLEKTFTDIIVANASQDLISLSQPLVIKKKPYEKEYTFPKRLFLRRQPMSAEIFSVDELLCILGYTLPKPVKEGILDVGENDYHTIRNIFFVEVGKFKVCCVEATRYIYHGHWSLACHLLQKGVEQKSIRENVTIFTKRI